MLFEVVEGGRRALEHLLELFLDCCHFVTSRFTVLS
jgi:hypothetical protein